ncbi:MAG: RelA/SpoT family protein, partial [Candidatus Gracilibacteria bacterium]
MAADLKKILSVVGSYLPDANLERISEAYKFAEEKHAGQMRFSGEPYFIHPVAATMHLLSLKPDEDTIIACLLHDVIEDTDTDVEAIQKKFGKTVAQLCMDMEKLGTVRYQGQERQIENLRKMFVAMARDLRVIFIKLADRLHNMETLEFVRPDKQQRIAQETLQVYAPIAARLGIFEFKAKLEDLAFKVLHPEDYAKLKKELAGSIENQEAFVSKAKKELKNILQKEGIKVEVFGRVKHLYSIWRKMKLKNYPSLDELYDLFALRVITKTTAECYATLGIIHNHYTPLSRRFKDFIAVPKPNGYRSLHTTVIGLSRQSPTEIQIRTQEMHEQAEYGAAAHWQYSAKKKSVKVDEEKLKWVKNLVELHEKMQDNEEFQENLTSDVLENRIFILTPHGDVFDLPEGATPIDFAYAVHTGVGNTAVGAKVNGKIVKLDEKLHNGEVVEIITRKDAKPNRFWLSFVKTSGAKSKIKAHFGQMDQGENLTLGKDLINAKLT